MVERQLRAESSLVCSQQCQPLSLLTSDHFQTLLTHAQQSHSHYALAVCLPSGSDWYLGLLCSVRLSPVPVIDSCNPWISIRVDLKFCLPLLQCYCLSISSCHTLPNRMWTWQISLFQSLDVMYEVFGLSGVDLCAVVNVNDCLCVDKQWKCAVLDFSLYFSTLVLLVCSVSAFIMKGFLYGCNRADSCWLRFRYRVESLLFSSLLFSSLLFSSPRQTDKLLASGSIKWVWRSNQYSWLSTEPSDFFQTIWAKWQCSILEVCCSRSGKLHRHQC